MAKNICIISECQQILGVGGTETVSFLLKNELKKNGYNVTSLFFIQKSALTEEDLLFPDSIDIASIKNKNYLINLIVEKKIEIILSQGTTHDNILNLCTEAKTHTNIKLVHTNHFNPLMGIKDYDDYKEKLINKKNNPIKKFFFSLILEIKRPWYVFNSKKSISNRYRKIDIDNIDAFVSLNEEYSRFSSRLFSPQHKEKFHTIANPIVIDDYANNKTKENIILFVGRLSSQKRLDRLLYIWNSIYRKFPEWELVVVGDGYYANEYKKIATNLGLRNINFVGQQPSEGYFKKSKIMCMTSSHEGLPMVLIEAQKYGCVPIAYNSFEAAKDIIQNYHNGVLVAPFNEKEYTKALRTLITNDEMRKRLAANGKEFIKKFDSKMIVKEWIKLFNSL